MRSRARCLVLSVVVLLAAALAALGTAVPGLQPPPGPGPAPALCAAGALASAAAEEPAVAAGVSTVPVDRIEVSVDAVAPRSSPRDAERIRARAHALAAKLPLDAAGEEALLDVLLEEERRRAAAFAERRTTPDQVAANARARAELDAILAWKTKALHDRFGFAVATTLMQR